MHRLQNSPDRFQTPLVELTDSEDEEVNGIDSDKEEGPLLDKVKRLELKVKELQKIIATYQAVNEPPHPQTITPPPRLPPTQTTTPPQTPSALTTLPQTPIIIPRLQLQVGAEASTIAVPLPSRVGASTIEEKFFEIRI
jgi:hypothetical protein